MKQIFRFLPTVLFLFTLVVISFNARSQSFQIDTFLQHQMREYHIPAVSVAVIENGKVILMKTYGVANIEYNIPNTPGTAFQLGSATEIDICNSNHDTGARRKIRP
jgi:CubicO group peptidase (beta-lactamase class C family)